MLPAMLEMSAHVSSTIAVLISAVHHGLGERVQRANPQFPSTAFIPAHASSDGHQNSAIRRGQSTDLVSRTALSCAIHTGDGHVTDTTPMPGAEIR